MLPSAAIENVADGIIWDPKVAGHIFTRHATAEQSLHLNYGCLIQLGRTGILTPWSTILGNLIVLIIFVGTKE